MKALVSLLALLAMGMAEPDHAEPIAAGAGFGGRGLAGCPSDLLYLNQLSGWQLRWPQQWRELSRAPDDRLQAAIAEWRKAPQALRADEAALAARTNAPAPRVIVERVLAQVDELSAELGRGPPPLRTDVSPALAAEWKQLFATDLAPAVRRYRTFLRDQYLPRSSAAAGLAAVPGGAECFRNAVRVFSSLDVRPEEIERVGWRILRETQADLMKLHKVDRKELPRLLERLRARREPGFTAERLIALSEAAVRRGTAAAPRMFLRRPAAPVIIQRLPQSMERSFTAAAYEASHGPDDPARFVLNTSRPDERRLMAEVIAFHETIPGHHAADAMGYPYGRPNSGFLEGWGIYAEYLADEMGLYSSDLDRTGMMAKHLWAASRMIMETGLHARGWSRDKAIRFMRERTALSEADIEVEVDRSISNVGQPVSYMLGYDRIRAARRHAETVLGSRFDLREFHDVVLAKGGRPLPDVQADVERWAAAKR